MNSITPQDTMGSAQQFEHMEYNMTDNCCQVIYVITCPIACLALIPGFMGKKTFILEQEEAVYAADCTCCTTNVRLPYGELGSVDKYELCGFIGVSSNLTKGTAIFPGSGCNQQFVEEVVKELKARMKARGDTGQIQRTEELMTHISEIKMEMKQLREDVGKILEYMQSTEKMER